MTHQLLRLGSEMEPFSDEQRDETRTGAHSRSTAETAAQRQEVSDINDHPDETRGDGSVNR
jgi:hypothetical protein